MPLYFYLSNSSCYAIHGTIYFFKDFPTHMAPTSIKQPTFLFNDKSINLCHKGF